MGLVGAILLVVAVMSVVFGGPVWLTATAAIFAVIGLLAWILGAKNGGEELFDAFLDFTWIASMFDDD
ncbi:MAG: hypothetical protein NUV56_01600 [Candidatus Uhrbacteria bacterium]|nr:hypothetical protein [Candidatus Uhrbacteria bacterium]